MTLFFSLLDPTEKTLTWLSAGHGPIFHYRADPKKVTELEPTLLPLGIQAGINFGPIKKIKLTAGNFLAIGTDGIWESVNAKGEIFGSERVLTMLSTLATESAGQIAAKIQAAVGDFRGHVPRDDDQTLMVLKAS